MTANGSCCQAVACPSNQGWYNLIQVLVSTQPEAVNVELFQQQWHCPVRAQVPPEIERD